MGKFFIVLDDEDIMIRLLTRVLGQDDVLKGMEARFCSTPDEAWDAYREMRAQGQQLAFALCDVQQPGWKDWAFIEWLSGPEGQVNRARIVAMSADERNQMVAEGRGLTFFRKPFDNLGFLSCHLAMLAVT